jgi:hypothetical protein
VGLERPGAQVVFDADQAGQTVVASVLSEVTPGDYDAGLVYSRDGGGSWKWGGIAAGSGRTFPEGVMLIDGGAVIVGATQSGDGAQMISRAFMARAVSPNYSLEELTLPAAFDGDGVHLQDVIDVDGEWVVAGYVAALVDPDKPRRPMAALWRSSDQGATWARQDIKMKGLQELSITQIAIAPDGSWNLVGQGGSGDIFAQYDAVWLSSTDRGATFTREAQKGLAGDFDQGASSISFADDGSAAITGWDEVNDEHGTAVSALWVSAPGHGVTRIGGPKIAIWDAETPPGQFLDGAVWHGNTPILWGSANGDYPAEKVQFWTIKGSKLQPTTSLSAAGTPLAVATILDGSTGALAFGLMGELDQADVGVWRGTLDGS